MEDIKKLIFQLKRSGEYFITGQQKLALNTEILHTINTKVLSSLHSDHILDHHYLCEILKKVTKLNLFNSLNVAFNSSINLSPFHSIIYLELHDINLECLIGLNFDQIEVVIVNGPIKSLAILLKKKLANLKYLALRGCRLKALDESLLLTPYLTYLDVSRNLLTKLENVEKLQRLDNLKLSVNRLTHVPTLSDYGARNLTILILNYNFINDNTTGLSKLTNLKVLDLSNNMILHHESISAVGDMAFLKYLNLENNPISFIEKHREITCGYLHENAAVELFELDNQLLSKSEKKFAGQFSRSLDLSFMHYRETPTSIKATKIRSPVIQNHVSDENRIIQTPILQIITKKDILKSEHLTTKKQIENIREKFGENNWLHSQGGSYVQEILGIKQLAENESLSQQVTTEEPAIIESNSKLNDTTDEKQFPVINSESHVEWNNDTEMVNQNMVDSTNMDNFTLKEDEDHIILAENNWRAQIIGDTKTGQCSNIILCLTEKDLKERSSIDGHLLATWSRDSIISCIKISFDPITIQLNFMTIRKNLNQRIYVMSDCDSKEFISIICKELESRTLSEMDQLVFKCVKCTTIFCQEKNSYFIKEKKRNCCPSCECSIVVLIEEEPLPCASNTSDRYSEKNDLNVIEKESSNDSTPINSRSSSEEPEERKLSLNDSDIEIISNTSGSSIEVLEIITEPEPKKEKKKPIDVRTELTESSSSGSMTDSVCTAYESKKKRYDSSSTLKDTGSNTESRIPSVVDLPIQFSYTDFTTVDQRLKYYVQEKFFWENEEFVLVFRCNCIMTSPTHRVDGCAIISTRAFYVFKFIGQPDKLLQKVSSHRLSLVKSIATLPWNVGLSICVTQPDRDMKYTFVLFVPHITTRLIAIIESIKPFEQRDVLISSPNTNSYLYVNNILYKNELHLPIIHVIFCECATIITENGLVEVIDLPGVVITEYECVVLAGECAWLLPYEDHFPTLAHVQHMTSFNHVDKKEETLGLHFNDNVSWLLIVNHLEAVHVMVETIRILRNAKQKSCTAIELAKLNCSTSAN